METQDEATGLRGVPWRLSYRTSALKPDGQPVDILHDFYLPALHRAVCYDRVAGYFRSSSLAAASQGFSAFVGRQGSMRLIVGADLEPQDVQAILNGAEERLAATLNAALMQPEAWPEAVSRGVVLLAWMVAHGYLDVRVALRVHAQTGTPLPATAVADGYVHMKWAVLTDADGNRLYMSGSLNESHAALVMNAENIDVHCDWYGDTDRQRVDEAEHEFQRLWDNQHPSLRVLTLPEAVHRRLLTLAAGVTQPQEIDGSSAAPLAVPPPSALERLRFALLRDGPRLPGGRYVGMETAPVAPWPHQAVVARRLIDTWPYSYLLCDEVGLGKTIEAGLAIRSLVLSGLVQRVLIGAPASLTSQWQREMADKFLLPFARALGGASPHHEYLLPSPTQRVASSLYEPDLVIVSTGLLARQERQIALSAALPFDLALIDEAHYARRQNPSAGSKAHPEYGQLYQTIVQHLRPKSRCLLLATATPMQIDPVEVADLLQLTHRVGAFQYDPSLMATYYDALGRLVQGLAIGTQEWTFLRRAVLAVRDQDPTFWAFLEQAVIDGRIRLTVRQWLDQDRTPRRADLPGLSRLIFAAAPLSRVMLRHTRSLLELYRDAGRLGANLAQRHILPIPRITFTDQERQAYEQLKTYCKGLAAQMAAHDNTRTRGAVGFLMSFLRLRFASSLFAIHETLRRRAQRVQAALDYLHLENGVEPPDIEGEEGLDTDADADDTAAVQALLRHRSPVDLHWERDQLQKMLATLADLSGPSSKMRELFVVLDQRRIAGTERFRQTVIFTRFYDTLSDIVTRLRCAAPGMLIGTYSGQGGQYVEPHTGTLLAVERDVVKHRFLRQQLDILICTDAAAEGLNLQTADLLVNFDLPWNPMKVEQRIGRIDRIGQMYHDIDVLNLCYVDSAEHIVYGRLLTRLTAIGAIVGTQQLSLLPVTPDEFAQLADNSLSATELEQRATARALQARHRTASMEIPAQDLYNTYLRLEQQQDAISLPVTLSTLWDTLARSTYLHALGCRILPELGPQTMRLAGIPTVPDGTIITASRTVYEDGVSFATYGNPIFDAILAHIGTFRLPPCIQRLEGTVPGLPVPVVAYAVAEAGQHGTLACRLVTALQDVDTLQLDEEVELTDTALEPLRHALAVQARATVQTLLAVPDIEAWNEAAGCSQKLFTALVLRGILASRQRTHSADPLFWREIAALEELCQTPDYVLRVRRIPSAHVRILSHLLFDLTIPHAGEESHLDVPRPLLIASVEAACRLADSMRVRRAELSTEDFLARLEREIAKMVA